MKTFGRVWLGIGLAAIGLGILMMILAGVTGFTTRKVPTFSVSETYNDDIKSLDLQFNYGEIKLVEGDEFSIEGSHLQDKEGFTSEVKDGVWVIRETGSERIHVFGFRVPVSLGFHGTPSITITIPKGFAAENVRLELGAGSMTVDSITANTGSFIVDAGELIVEQLNISEQSRYSVSAGYMKLYNINADNVVVDCGAGYINMEGTITGKNEISCDIGRIKLALEGDPKDYSYHMDTDIGNVVLNGKKYTGSYSRSSKAELGSFDMECSIGNITLDIHE